MSYEQAAQLEQKAAALERAAAQLKSGSSQLRGLSGSLLSAAQGVVLGGSRGWKGPAATRYLRAVESRDNRIGSVRSTMERLADQYLAQAATLRNQAQRLREAEAARRAAARRAAAQRSRSSR